MIKIEQIGTGRLSRPVIHQILELENKVWPSPDPLETRYAAYVARRPGRTHCQTVLVWDDNRLIGHAKIFGREISCAGQKLRVGCLSSVCVAPDRQGEGLGRAMVRKMFATAATGVYEVILFQTGVPGFYQKLGARLVDNRFVNSCSDRPQDNPWRERYVMIYPGEYDWPAGVIDLKGDGF